MVSTLTQKSWRSRVGVGKRLRGWGMEEIRRLAVAWGVRRLHFLRRWLRILRVHFDPLWVHKGDWREGVTSGPILDDFSAEIPTQWMDPRSHEARLVINGTCRQMLDYFCMRNLSRNCFKKEGVFDRNRTIGFKTITYPPSSRCCL
eukprot:1369004-Amorphochlora_amoeboformis.AAC.1